MRLTIPPRWLAVSVFVLSATISFLDRQVLAALAPQLRAEFSLTNQQYGYLVSAFSLVYAASAPFMGLFIDRVGLNLGSSVVLGLWSLAGMATGLVNGLAGLLICRAVLGAAQAGGVPASGKAFAIYLPPHERALGSAFSQLGISLGMVGAPLFGGWLAEAYGWRAAFVVSGAIGFLWIPAWLAAARRAPVYEAPSAIRLGAARELLSDLRMWKLAAANVLLMSVYSLWMNWTTVFLVETYGLSQVAANRRLAWIPPILAALGGLAGGWLAMRWACGGGDAAAARRRVCTVGAFALLATGAAPFMPGPVLGTAVVCWSFFWTVTISVNLYAMPLDIFGASRAALGVSVLTFAYGAMQTLISPAYGRLIDAYGFGPVCLAAGILPLAAVAILRTTR